MTVSLPKCIQIFALLSLTLLCLGCGGSSGSDASKTAIDLERGKALAYRHCIACHQVPEPELLTQRSWEYALTYMGFFLGVVDYQSMEGVEAFAWDSIHLREEFVREAGMIPDEPLISEEDWKQLRDYYVANAPEKALPQSDKPRISAKLDLFQVAKTQYRMDAAITSMVYIDETNGLLYVHDSGAERLTVLDRSFNFHDAHPSPGVALVEARSDSDSLYLLSIGDLFASNIGGKFGELQRTRVLSGVFMGLEILVKGLHRPADFDLADLDNDGSDEFLVSNFGDYTGNFSVYRKNDATGEFSDSPIVLSEQPGIVKGEAYDFNSDGYRDILVMASAARENVSLFLNNGKGGFHQEVLWEKHPSFGYIGFELRDFNGDGAMDILTLNGDNGDSDPFNTLKRDHGIRIYLNRGGLSFEEAYFYPMYGVYGAEVADFDQDGDLDIAAIAYHPDFDAENPENFVFLEQTSSLVFSPSTHPATFDGRWLSMDSGDADGDGDVDIVLGAAYVPVGMRDRHMDRFEKLVQEAPPILVLENTLN
jgi:hypothetical protein